jgi:aryl-alcohol dehydrogenase-like predicted oxidoreductase
MWSLAKADLSQSDPTWGYMDESFAQWHLKNGLAAFPFISQAGGYFRRLDQGALDQLSADNRVRRMFDHQENHARFQRIRRLQEKTKLSVSQIVLGYLTNQPFPVFPLIGPKTLPDLRESISNAGATLPQAALSYLEHGNRSLVGSIF